MSWKLTSFISGTNIGLPLLEFLYLGINVGNHIIRDKIFNKMLNIL